MTEDEARTKLCPMARCHHVPGRSMPETIRSGKVSAKGLVIPTDLKLGGASMTKAKRLEIEARLGSDVLMIGEEGRFFVSRAKLRSTLARAGEEEGLLNRGLLGSVAKKAEIVGTIVSVGVAINLLSEGKGWAAAKAVIDGTPAGFVVDAASAIWSPVFTAQDSVEILKRERDAAFDRVSEILDDTNKNAPPVSADTKAALEAYSPPAIRHDRSGEIIQGMALWQASIALIIYGQLYGQTNPAGIPLFVPFRLPSQ
jgi:hypothetical protein